MQIQAALAKRLAVIGNIDQCNVTLLRIGLQKVDGLAQQPLGIGRGPVVAGVLARFGRRFGATDATAARAAPQVRGNVTPTWPWYLPPRSLYEVSQTSSDWKNSICATPSPA